MPGVRLTSRERLAADEDGLLGRMGRGLAPARKFREPAPSIAHPGGRAIAQWNNLGLEDGAPHPFRGAGIGGRPEAGQCMKKG